MIVVLRKPAFTGEVTMAAMMDSAWGLMSKEHWD